MTTAMRYDIRPVILTLADIARQALTADGFGAQISASVESGAITAATVDAGGSGYADYVRLAFDGGQYPAEGAARVAAGSIADVTMLDTGMGYDGPPAVRIEPYLRWVYDAIPPVFSESGPFMFFEYMGGVNTSDTFGVLTTREYNINAIACHVLAQETAEADRRTREFTGVFYDLIFRNRTLGGLVHSAYVTKDEVRQALVKTSTANQGGTRYMANVFTITVLEGEG
jgi:hypothetical protein